MATTAPPGYGVSALPVPLRRMTIIFVADHPHHHLQILPIQAFSFFCIFRFHCDPFVCIFILHVSSSIFHFAFCVFHFAFFVFILLSSFESPSSPKTLFWPKKSPKCGQNWDLASTPRRLGSHQPNIVKV